MKTIPVSCLMVGVLWSATGLVQAQDRPPGPPPAEKPARRGPAKTPEEAWKLADTDRDGAISTEEFAAIPRIQRLPEEKQQTIFKRLDKDADDQLSRDELGRLSRPPPGPPLQRLWELDADKSGGVSPEEFKAGQLFKKLPPEKREEVFRRLDTDGDGLVTPKDKPELPRKRPHGKKGPKPPVDCEPGERPTFQRKLDLNGDGALTFEEFRQGAAVKNLTEDQQEQRFEKLDRNQDLKISEEDFPPPPPPESPPREERQGKN